MAPVIQKPAPDFAGTAVLPDGRCGGGAPCPRGGGGGTCRTGDSGRGSSPAVVLRLLRGGGPLSPPEAEAGTPPGRGPGLRAVTVGNPSPGCRGGGGCQPDAHGRPVAPPPPRGARESPPAAESLLEVVTVDVPASPAPAPAPPRRPDEKISRRGRTTFLRTPSPGGPCPPSAGADGRELTGLWRRRRRRRNSFKEIGPADYKGKWLVLYFYPLDFTFVCPTEICAFSDRVGEFHKLGAEVVGVSVDSKYAHLAFSQLERKKVRPPRPPARPPRPAPSSSSPSSVRDPQGGTGLTRRGGGGTATGAHCRAGWAGASTRCWRTSPRRCRRTTAC